MRLLNPCAKTQVSLATRTYLVLGLVCSPALQAAEQWLPDTPLRPVYQAMLDDQPRLAWQQLTTALDDTTTPVASSHWLPVLEQILAQTACGRALSPATSPVPASHDAGQPQIRLVLQRRITPHQQVFQVKVSLEQLTKPVKVVLSDTRQQVIFSGTTPTPTQGYAELEGAELTQPLAAGLYHLQIDQRRYPVLIKASSPEPWVSLSALNARQMTSIRFSLPDPSPGCQAPQVNWQWFDQQYHLAAPMQPVALTAQGEARLPQSIPPGAALLSGVVTQRYHQGAVTLLQKHRLTLPLRFFITEQITNRPADSEK